MKKLLLLVLMVAVNLSLFSCTPESFTDPVEEVQACCENEGGLETPPPPPPPADNNKD
jgi:hypothetical protein|tara:strand:+ start:53 stop:226 length:174 start_codon:yes stop_codon:yes gene_type:complete